MKRLLDVTSSLASKINALISQAEAANPGMREVAAMVYVGDVYVLREQVRRAHDDGWGKHCYTCDSTDHL